MGFHKFDCKNCGEIELNIPMSQIPLEKCPICQCTEIEKVFSAVNDVWKTSGAFSKSNHKE